MTHPDHQQQIILLERTLTDFDYQPPTWSGSLHQRNAKDGLLAVCKVECDPCGGKGKLPARGRVVVPCERCGGCITIDENGDAQIVMGRGWVEIDPMDNQREPIGSDRTGQVLDRRGWVRCDSCGGGAFGRAPGVHGNGQACRHCADSGRPGWVRAPEQKARPWRDRAPLSAASDTFAAGDPVLACMERRVLAGSYEELGLALAALQLERGRLYRLNVGVFVEANREEDELDRYEALLVEEGLAYLASLMPREIRVPSWAATYEQRRREQVLSKREVAA